MNIHVRFTDKAIEATAFIKLSEKSSVLRFALSQEMEVQKIRVNGLQAKFQRGDSVQLPFTSPCVWYEVQCKEIVVTAEIQYRGLPVGWHNHMNSDVRAFSMYSGWYPQAGSIGKPIGLVTVADSSDWLLINGEWCEQIQRWNYDGAIHDPYNLIMYRNDALRVVSTAYMDVYYVDANMGQTAKMYAESYSDVLDYYNGNLYPAHDIQKMKLASIYPASQDKGAYFRKGLIVQGEMNADPIMAKYMNAHELAHEWCCGADTQTWEDWLNETTAEWSALIYAIDRKDQALFDYILSQHLEKAPTLPAIRTEDGSRPDGVHSKGTVLFYDVYRKCGIDVIRKILRAFTVAENKTTQQLVSVIRSDISTEAADIIEAGITK